MKRVSPPYTLLEGPLRKAKGLVTTLIKSCFNVIAFNKESYVMNMFFEIDSNLCKFE